MNDTLGVEIGEGLQALLANGGDLFFVHSETERESVLGSIRHSIYATGLSVGRHLYFVCELYD